jgi:hypothetical protein
VQEQARVLLVTRARNARRDLINGLAPLGWPLRLADSPGAALAALAGAGFAGIAVSLIGRNTTGWTIVGDFELSGSAAGAVQQAVAEQVILPMLEFHH